MASSLSGQPSKTAIRSPGGGRGSNGPTVKFARRTSSGRYASLSRDDLNMSGELSGAYLNYTVHIPPTPDNQPMESLVAAKAEEQYVSNSLFTGGLSSATRAHLMDKVVDSEVGRPQMAGSNWSQCGMPACDGMVMTDESGEDIHPCDCRFEICGDCFIDVQKDRGLCPGCKEPYKSANYEDNAEDFTIGALPVPPPGKGDDNMTMMKRNQGGEFCRPTDHSGIRKLRMGRGIAQFGGRDIS